MEGQLGLEMNGQFGKKTFFAKKGTERSPGLQKTII